MKSLVIALVAAIVLLVPSLTSAQERVTIDINYGANLIGHGAISAFDYPLKPTMTSGKSYDTNGVEIAAKVVAITDVLIVNGRYEHAGLRNAQFFINDRQVYRGGNIPGLQVEPDLQAIGGSVNYWELSGSFKLPKTHGHSLVAGVAKEKLSRDFTTTEVGDGPSFSYAIHASHLGLVVGGEGKQKFGNVTLDYAGRLYPRMARRDYEIAPGANYPSPDSSSFGYEVRGTATWMVTKYIGLTGGYEFRRLRTEMGANSSWPINENQDSKLAIVGLRVRF